MSGMEIRAAGPSDLTRLLTMATGFYSEGRFTTTVSELRSNLATLLRTDTARVAIAARQDDIVGFAITTLGFGLEHGAIAELQDLFVEPAHRRSGVGAALIEDSASWAESRGCRTLELVIAPNGKNVAHLFGYYARRNFTDQGRRLLSRNLSH
ncbi:GNAT family N-acetyltransferase [uncultured Mycobacterium sp.]|uniref:GNAT family N-acetyltransferase n=1 Tax=uncultured Mycobacterium sp. TaxID=171292 RepID=UPI0035C9C9E2